MCYNNNGGNFVNCNTCYCSSSSCRRQCNKCNNNNNGNFVNCNTCYCSSNTCYNQCSKCFNNNNNGGNFGGNSAIANCNSCSCSYVSCQNQCYKCNNNYDGWRAGSNGGVNARDTGAPDQSNNESVNSPVNFDA